ncbi:unnamed protein product [Withania somnifera]
MADTTSLDVILEFLPKNKFTGAEAALRGELNIRSGLNGVVEKLTLQDEELSRYLKANEGKVTVENFGMACLNGGEVFKETSSRSSGETSKEFIVKEIECGIGINGSDCYLKNVAFEKKKELNESVGTYNKIFGVCNNTEDTMIDMYPWNYSPSNGSLVSYQDNGGTSAAKDSSGLVHNPSNGSRDFSGLVHSGKLRLNLSEVFDSGKSHTKSGEDVSFSGEKRMSFPGSTSKDNVEAKHGSQNSDLKEANHQTKLIGASKDVIISYPRLKSDESTNLSSKPWKDCSGKTVFTIGKRITEGNDVRNTFEEQVDEVGRDLYQGKTPGSEPKDIICLGFSLMSESQKQELPRLPPVRIKSEEKSFNIHWEEKFKRDGPASKITNGDNTYVTGSFLDVLIGEELTNSGGKRIGGGSWLSVSQGIAEDTSELVSDFATIGDGLSESLDFPNEYWDSDEYDDDDDVGYMRQPIKDESWVLAHEIDYPEKGTGHRSVPDPQGEENKEDDEQLLQRKIPTYQAPMDDIYVDGDQRVSVRSIGVGINSDTADISSDLCERYLHDHDASIGGARHIPPHSDKPFSEIRNRDEKTVEPKSDKFVSGTHKGRSVQTNHLRGDFSFALAGDGQFIHKSSSKSLWSSKGNPIITDEAHESLIANDDMLGSLRHKSNGSSPIKSSLDESNKITCLGSAAFSKAVQAHDVYTGMAGLTVLRLQRTTKIFLIREHLLIVCELLKANLYEFQKFNRESGGEVYFTMPRLQFLHGLGLIYFDLKPKSILVKSYCRCEVKVIDLGSSCFETDHFKLFWGFLMIKKIDIWSLGCILTELCTGNETSRLEYLIPKKTKYRLPMADQGFIDFVAHLLEVIPKKRPCALDSQSYPYETISS